MEGDGILPNAIAHVAIVLFLVLLVVVLLRTILLFSTLWIYPAARMFGAIGPLRPVVRRLEARLTFEREATRSSRA